MTENIIIKTLTNKNINEDHIEIFYNPILDIGGFVLADGIGSHYKAEEGAQFSVKKMCYYITNCKTISELDFKQFYNNVYNDLQTEYLNSKFKNLELDPKISYGTTLICALELKDKFVISYLGNGSIWHLRGNYINTSPQMYFSWNMMNMLNPHTLEKDGKEVLYKYMALDSSPNQIIPTTIELLKDNDIFGDIIICSTDGLHSNDQVPIAKDREGNIWISGNKKIQILTEKIKDLILNNKLIPPEIENCLDTFLNEINSNKLVDDDLTFGIIFTDQIETLSRN